MRVQHSAPALQASQQSDLNYLALNSYFFRILLGQYDIWLANSDASEARQITRMPAIMTAYGRWSPDGRSLVFHSRLNGYANLYIVDVETGGYRPLTTGSTNDSAASWSPDNKWIFFESERSGIPQIWKIPAAGGPASQVTRNGAAVALPSPDGKMLVYSKFNAPGLWMLRLAGGDEVQLAPAISTIDSFAVTKTGVYLARPTPNREVSIAFLSFEDRTTQELARLKVPACYGLSVSPDQRSILYAQTDYLASDLILGDHFN